MSYRIVSYRISFNTKFQLTIKTRIKGTGLTLAIFAGVHNYDAEALFSYLHQVKKEMMVL